MGEKSTFVDFFSIECGKHHFWLHTHQKFINTVRVSQFDRFVVIRTCQIYLLALYEIWIFLVFPDSDFTRKIENCVRIINVRLQTHQNWVKPNFESGIFRIFTGKLKIKSKIIFFWTFKPIKTITKFLIRNIPEFSDPDFYRKNRKLSRKWSFLDFKPIKTIAKLTRR